MREPTATMDEPVPEPIGVDADVSTSLKTRATSAVEDLNARLGFGASLPG